MHTPQSFRLGLVGHAGRMGQQVIECLHNPDPTRAALQPAPQLAALLIHRTPAPQALASLGQSDVAAFVQSVDVILDFSAPAACAVLSPLCARHGKALLVASTGLSPTDDAALDDAATSVPVLVAANLSVGVNVLMELVALAARRLADADIEVFDVHHRNKRDAPSGTALALGQAAAKGRLGSGQQLQPVLARTGHTQRRRPSEIGYGALRGGDVAGEHTVFFLGDGERVELAHKATRPDIFARGALLACSWLAHGRPGRYTMQDVLGGP